jgi:hypothetical protein
MRRLLIGVALAAAPLTAKTPPTPPVVTGPPISCVMVRNIRSTTVIDDSTIDFHMMGRQTFRNTLPHRCPQLGFERAFAYQTQNTQLCSVDIITVIVQGSASMRGASCGLGKFTPIAAPARK